MSRGIYKHKSHSEETKLKMSLAKKGRPANSSGMLGHRHTKETRQKIKNALSGEKNPNFGKKATLEERIKRSKMAKKLGIGKWMLGKKLSEKTRAKMRMRRGENSPAWRGGKMRNYSEIERLRKSPEYKLWRTAVFERDDYTCIWCGDNSGGNLNADHIKPFSLFPELRFAIDNGRTLCEDCHKKTDTFGGKLNNKNL